MSKKLLDLLQKELGDKIAETSTRFDDHEVTVDKKHYKAIATFLREDPRAAMDHFVDLTAIDYPEREGPRFDVLLTVRSMEHNHRIRLVTRADDGESVPTVSDVWMGANWAEREAYDMFGVTFEGHPDLRRILMYEEFEGFPLRKDYPIERTQPLVAYRDVEGIDKLPPFGPDMGQPWGRIDWSERLAGRDLQVSPSIGVQVGQRRALSDSTDSLGDAATEED